MLHTLHTLNVYSDLTETKLHTALHYSSCVDPEGGGVGVRPPPHHSQNHKNIGILSNTGPDPLKNRKAPKPAFNVGPS